MQLMEGNKRKGGGGGVTKGWGLDHVLMDSCWQGWEDVDAERWDVVNMTKDRRSPESMSEPSHRLNFPSTL